MSRFPLYLRNRLASRDHQNVNRALRDTTTTDDKIYATTLAGDTRKLRGIPAIGRNVRGAIPGTTPGENLA